MPRGRPKKLPYVAKPAEPLKVERRAYRSPMDIVTMMKQFQALSDGKMRGMFEDCKADIYRLWLLDYNDWRLSEVKGTGVSDRVYGEWERKFTRAFGVLQQPEVAA